MGIVYLDYEPVTVDKLVRVLPDIQGKQRIAVDTETSGLFIDGDYDKAPPARASMVSLAWRDYEGVRTLAIPFDQGRVGGKPGKWSHELDAYEAIPHAETCQIDGSGFMCTCCPWNFDLDEWALLLKWLRARYMVMQNLKFDTHIFNAGHRLNANLRADFEDNVVWDTMLASGVLWPLQSSSLDNIGKRILGEGKGGTDELDAALRKNGVGLTKRYDLVPLQAIGPYAAKDAELTLRLFEKQQAMIGDGLVDDVDERIIETEIRLAKLLYRMEVRGVGFDAAQMRIEADKMRVEIARIESELPFRPPNVNAAKKWFFDELGVMPIKVTPKGKASLDAEVVARLAADDVPGAKQYAHLANMLSALSKWYVSWPYKCGSDGRIRTNFRQGRIESDHKGMTSGGAISGRLSAERVQLQGVPQDWRIPEGITGVKKLFRAKDGYQLWQFDLSNAEVRVGAWASRCKALADRINSGANIHDVNTIGIFGSSLVDTFPGGWPENTPIDAYLYDDDGNVVYKEGAPVFLLSKHPRWKQYRTSAKRGIFGRFYGAGIRTLKTQIDNDLKTSIPQNQIQAFMDALDGEYPEIQAASKRAERKVNKQRGGCGYVRLANGRKRVFGAAEHTYKAFNAVIQGGVAEVMKLWMLMIEEHTPGLLVNQVHDAVWLELPNERAEEMIALFKRMGEELYESFFSTEDIPIKFTVDAERLA